MTNRVFRGAHKTVIDEQPCRGSILKDQMIDVGSKRRKQQFLREICVRAEGDKKVLSIVTNDFTSDAQEIADLYKKRWQIELFFKWIKQNLKIKTFLGTSENAVKTQILIAMISYLLPRLWQNVTQHRGSLHALARIIQTNLVTRKAIWELFKPPPIRHRSNKIQLVMEAIYA